MQSFAPSLGSFATTACSKLEADVNGNRQSTGYCAKAVVTAIQKAKGQPVQGEGNAKDLGPFLVRSGYRATGKTTGSAANGDVTIFHAVRSHQYGHVCMKCHGTWVSDFI